MTTASIPKVGPQGGGGFIPHPAATAPSRCLACFGPLAPVLAALGSLRCHDCRASNVPLHRFGSWITEPTEGHVLHGLKEAA